MNPETARWYHQLVEAYLENPQAAQARYLLEPEAFLLILREIFGNESLTLAEAKDLLEKLASGTLPSQNVPPPETLRLWQEELEEAQRKRREINQKVAAELAKQIQARKAMVAKIQELLRQTGNKTIIEEPGLAESLGQQAEEIIHQQVSEQETLTKERYQENLAALAPQFDHLLKEKGVFLPPSIMAGFAQGVTEKTFPEEIPEKALPIVPLGGPAKPEARPQAPPPLFTEAVKEKFSLEEEGVTFATLYTLLHPKLAASLAKKLALAPVVKTLQFLDLLSGEELTGEVVSQWREKLHQGTTAEDIQASLEALDEAGSPPEHPQVKQLETKRERIRTYEQIHPKISALLKHYHEFTKLTGRRQIFTEELKTFLPRLSPSPAWFSKLGKPSYSLRLKKILDGIGSHLVGYEKVALPSGKTVIQFALPDKTTRLLTFGRLQNFAAVRSWLGTKAIKPILVRLGKTALGQGIKKGAAWILTRLGLAAIPTGVTQAIAVGLFALDAAKFIFRRLKEKPLQTMLLGATLFFLPIILPMLPMIGFVLAAAGVALGVLGFLASAKTWLGGALTGVGNFLTGAANLAGGLLSSLTTISIPATLVTLPVIAATGGVGLLTFLVILNTSAAFLKEPAGPPPPVPVGSSYIEIFKRAFYVGRETQTIHNEDLTENSTLTYAITVTAKNKDLINLTITDNTILTLKNASTNINTDTDGKPIGPWKLSFLKSGEKWEKSYTLNIPKSRFENSLITNTVQVKAEAVQPDGQKTNEEKSLSFSVIIGTPPFSLDSIVAWGRQVVEKLEIGSVFGYFNRLISGLFSGIYNTGAWPGTKESNLYWCTYLIIDAYRLAGAPGLDKSAGHAATNIMERFFANSGASGYKYINYLNNPRGLAQIKPGYAMFMYRNYAYSSPPDGHVVLVTGVNINESGDGIISVIQSNADRKARDYTVSNWQISGSSFKIITGFGGI